MAADFTGAFVAVWVSGNLSRLIGRLLAGRLIAGIRGDDWLLRKNGLSSQL